LKSIRIHALKGIGSGLSILLYLTIRYARCLYLSFQEEKRRLSPSGLKKLRKQNILLTLNQGEQRRGSLIRAILSPKTLTQRILIRRAVERRRISSEIHIRIPQVALRPLLGLILVPVLIQAQSIGLIARKATSRVP